MYYENNKLQNNITLCSLFSVLCFSQDYQWDWAKHGGGSIKYGAEQPLYLSNFSAEMIWDIAIDEDNNYYFLASLSTGDTHVDGNPVTDYAASFNGAANTVIFSFTCEGTYRWSRPVGGGARASAYKLTLDNNGGIYIMFSVLNLTIEDSNDVPLHFSEDDVLPYWNGSYDEQDALKRIFLLKYAAEDGEIIWRKDIHGNVGGSNWFHNINHLQIDSNNILHTVVGFEQGVHLDGQLTVPEPEEDEGLKYYLLKFNHLTGALIGTPLLLPMGGGEFSQESMSFRYDETLNRYYIAGWKPYGTDSGTEVFFNDITFGQQNYSTAYCFLISFNPNDLDDWWYKEIVVSDEGINGSMISGIEIDSNSDIYITGNYFILNNDESAFWGDHTFSNTPYIGTRAFILKMNPEGEVQWSKVPDNQVSGGGQ